ncbi:MAG: pyruvate ferredoxin oxidoreductase [Thermoplasmata archaeon]|nr:MAG: pyruvate ferredoxin oxidoreductase [Thermoplasmata archaeon]
MKMVIRGNMATAVGAKLCRPNVVPAYPITPSTLFPEKMSEFVADGELDAEFITVESEHTAMSACIGASVTGARTCTATASQGLALMHEMLFIAAGMRLPIVMAIGNRALSAPINIWADHQDTISERDTGWLQFYAENNQESLDLMIMAFRISEDKRVLLPSMVGLDAFVLTHTFEAVDVPDQGDVDKFLPPYKPNHGTLDPSNPITMGAFVTPEHYMEFRYAIELAMNESRDVIDEVFEEYKKTFGREYKKLVPYDLEDAEIILITMGSISGTARVALEEMRKRHGKKVGLIKLTVLRPFPEKELLELTKNAKLVAVIERDISLGFGGAVFGEIAAKYVNKPDRPLITNYIVGLGGRDVTLKDFNEIVEKAEAALAAGEVEKQTEWINIKEDAL